MNPNLLLQFRWLFSVSFFFINIYCFERIAIAADPKMEDCEPKSCGSIKNVSYPFWIGGQQPDYCGYPGFNVTCSDDIPYLQTAYRVGPILDIFYDNESIWLSEANLSGYLCSNSVLIDDFSFAGSPFRITAVNKKLFLFHICQREQTGSFGLPCNPNETFAAYIGDDYYRPDTEISGECQLTTKLPVLGYVGAESRDFERLLEHGYLLDWKAPNCTECRASKGQCGYDHSKNEFMCICRDRVHRISCSEFLRRL